MTGMEALFQVYVHGKPVRRKAWEPGRYLRYERIGDRLADSGNFRVWVNCNSDFLQNDWEFYEEAKG